MSSRSSFSSNASTHWTRALATVAAVGALFLSGCSWFQGNEAPKPAPLPANPAQWAVQQVWRANAGAQGATTGARVLQGQLLVSNAAGEVTALDAKGQMLSRTAFGAPLTTAPGFDGQRLAAVTVNNDLVVFAGGKESWRQHLPAQSYAAPVVAGERVFVLLADRTVAAFDGDTGAKLWRLPRNDQQEPLVLDEAGVLLAVDNTLVAGIGPRLQGINPNSGQIMWDKAIASPRSTNDVERLADLVAPAYRAGGVVCARAYQTGIACVDAQTRQLLWNKASHGHTGLGGDDTEIFGSEADGRVRAWNRNTGELTWTNEQLLLRTLGVPVAWGDSVALGDKEGRVYFLKPSTGALLAYMGTDGSAVQATLVFDGQLIILTRSGSILAWRHA